MAIGISTVKQVIQDIESDMLARAQQGDGQAFGQLVELYQVPVYNLCYRMLGDSYEAEDAAQETFLRAYRSMERFDRQRPFSTWLLSIAAHHCIDQIRRKRMLMVPFEELYQVEIADPSPSPEKALSLGEEQKTVRELLEHLNPTDRAAIILRFWYDFSYEEIAQALDLSLSAVKSRLHRARKDLALNWIESSERNAAKERKVYESPAF